MLRTYEGIVGGKTGYDDDAGWCLINVAQRDGRRVIAVTMNGVAPDDWYDDNRVLLDYALDQQALRAQTGARITGEIASIRDPDAARILAMGSAGASVGEQLPSVLAEPVLAPPLSDEVAAAGSGLGVSGAGLSVAAIVSVVLIAVQGVATWRLCPPRREGVLLTARPPTLASGESGASD